MPDKEQPKAPEKVDRKLLETGNIDALIKDMKASLGTIYASPEWDKNQDGKLDKPIPGMKPLKREDWDKMPARYEELFKKADTNKDGNLSEAERNAHVHMNIKVADNMYNVVMSLHDIAEKSPKPATEVPDVKPKGPDQLDR